MHRARGCDAGFLLIESPTQTSVAVFVVELRPGVDDSGRPALLTLDSLRAHVGSRLHVLPSFRWRLEAVPFGFNQPVFIEDPDFDLEYHVRHDTVAAPGGPAEVDAYVASIAAGHFDLRHPMWQLILLDGLDDGRQALVLRVHHVITDGSAIRTTLRRLVTDLAGEDAVPEVGPSRSPSSAWTPDRVSPSRLALDGARDLVAAWKRVPALVRSTRVSSAARKARRAQAGVKVPKVLVDTPPSRLNVSYSTDRAYARGRVSLADVKRVKAGAGVSLNDVILACAAGALRGYLGSRDELPERPLTVNVPVSTEPADAPARQYGNHFANFLSTLATDIDDPWDRLQMISVVSAEGLRQLRLGGVETVAGWLDLPPPVLAAPAMRWWGGYGRRHPERAEYSVLVSNVRASAAPWSFGSTVVDDVHMSGPITDGGGLNMTVCSYGDHLNLSVLSNPTALDDPEELVFRFGQALSELVKIVDDRATEVLSGPASSARETG